MLNRWGYSGEIIGINAHLDQLQFMTRSGVTSYRLQDVNMTDMMKVIILMDLVFVISQPQIIQD